MKNALAVIELVLITHFDHCIQDMVIIWSLAQRITPYLPGCLVKQSACASSARVLYLSIYAGLPIGGERNQNQNYAYMRNQSTDLSLQRTLVSQMKYFVLNAQTDFLYYT